MTRPQVVLLVGSSGRTGGRVLQQLLARGVVAKLPVIVNRGTP